MSPDPRDELGGAILAQLVERIESATRFDRSSIAVGGASTEHVDVSARDVHVVTIASRTTEGAGRGEGDGLRVASEAELDATIASARAAATRALPARVQAWLDAGRDDALSAAQCLDGPHRATHAFACTPCEGRGRTRCENCRASGFVTCEKCRGFRKQRCDGPCNGTGSVQCSGCGGRGTYWEPRERTVWDATTQTSRIEHDQVTLPCGDCGATGSLTCKTCHGSGQIDCKPCNASGRTKCDPCKGNGTVGCAPCKTTGWKHRSAFLECSVRATFEAGGVSNRPDVVAWIRSIASLTALRELAPVTRGAATLSGATVTRPFHARLAVTTLRVDVAGKPLELVGYGARASVTDFKNVVGALLQRDLVTLSSRLDDGSDWSLGASAELDRAIDAFLGSEVHARIAARAGDGAAALEATCRGELRGSVSAQYALAAAATLRRALGRSHRSAMVSALGWSALVPVATLVLSLPLPRSWCDHRAAACALTGAVGVVLVERRSRSRFRERFGAASGARALELLDGPRRWGRLAGMAASAAVALAVALVLVRFLEARGLLAGWPW